MKTTIGWKPRELISVNCPVKASHFSMQTFNGTSACDWNHRATRGEFEEHGKRKDTEDGQRYCLSTKSKRGIKRERSGN